MIVSHKYGFIFVKTGKVGGTSLELALSAFLGPNDIITPVSPRDELDRAERGYRTCQHFEKRFPELRPSEWPKWAKHRLAMGVHSGNERLLGKRRLPKKFWNHMDAAAIRQRLGPSIWNNYFKFTIERNPWDKVVSRYYWESVKNDEGVSFSEFVRSGRPLKSDFERYAIGGLVAVDRVLRYDDMPAQLTEVSRRLDLPEDVGRRMGNMAAKRGYREIDEVTRFYDDWTRRSVDIFFGREIRLMGFTFD
jgi:hypothetical protein